MNNKILALAKSSCLGLALVSGLALASGQAAFDGIAATPAENVCWSHGWGGITNNCSGYRRWCMPLHVTAAGSYTVEVTAYGATSANNVGCFATGVNREITLQWSSAQKYLPGFGSSQVISLTGAFVPGYGVLYACCDVATGGRINSVVW